MSKPDGITDEAWAEAYNTVDAIFREDGVYSANLQYRLARAILAAEKRGEEREREACAQVSADFAPVMMAQTGVSRSDIANAVFESAASAANEIAAAIRKRGEA